MAVKFAACFFQRELPLYRGPGGIALGHARGDVGREFLLGGNALVQAPAGNGREFAFDHVEPGRILRRVMHLEARGQGPGLLGGQVLVEDGVGVGVEVVLHQPDFLGLRICGGQLLHEAAVVGAGAAGRDLDRALAGAGFEGGRPAGRALAHVGAALPAGAAGLGGLFAPRGLGRHGRQRLDGLAVQRAGALVEADHRVLRIAGPLVDGQHVLHAGHEGRVHFAQAPVLLAVGPQPVF